MPPRELRTATDVIFHVMNRAARRLRLFDEPSDYDVLVDVFEQGRQRTGIEVFAYCLMPNHFHLLVRQRKSNQVSEFMRWSLLTHAKRWRQRRDSHGFGAVYQGRYRAVPIQADQHFVAAARYIECNPLRAGLVSAADEWKWSSLNQRCSTSDRLTLTARPIPPDPDWVRRLNESVSPVELDAIRQAVRRGVPFGGQIWAKGLVGSRNSAEGRGRPARDNKPVDLGAL